MTTPNTTAQDIINAVDVWVALPATAGLWTTWLWLADLSNIQAAIVRAASGGAENDTE